MLELIDTKKAKVVFAVIGVAGALFILHANLKELFELILKPEVMA